VCDAKCLFPFFFWQVLGYDVNSAAAQLDDDTLKVAEKRR